MPEITAQLNYLRISPRKVRAVVNIIKGLDVDLAHAQLKYLTRRPAKPLLKLLNSAVSNARHNLGLDKNYLYVKEIIVNEGIKLKRYKPKGFGLAMPIQKKTSYIKIVLDELSGDKRRNKEELLAKMPKPPEVEKESIVKKPSVESSQPTKDKKDMKKEAKVEKPKFEKEVDRKSKKGVFGGIKTLSQKLFRRKSI